MPRIIIPSGSGEILFVTDNSASLDFRNNSNFRTGSGVIGKWEVDPDDGGSIQFRIPKEKFGGSNDRIGFYISSSGRIGIGTKDPETAFDVRDIGEDVDPKDRTAKTRILKVSRTSQIFDTPITASIISTSGNINAANILLPDDGVISFDNESTSDQFITGKDHFLTVDGDDILNLRADSNINLASPLTVLTGNLSGSSSNIIVGGHITSSGTIDGNIYTIQSQTLASRHGSGHISLGNTSDRLTLNGLTTEIGSPITASSNISSSGTIISNEITTTTLRAANGNGLIHDKKIWITPTDFDSNSLDGINGGIITDNGGNFADTGRRLIFYAQKYIPTGWKATAVKIEGSNTADRFTAYSSSFDVGTSAAVCGATSIGTEVSLATAVQGGGGVYLSIEWGSRGSTEVYGGYIQLTES